MYELEISVASLLDLSGDSHLADLGIGDAELTSDDFEACQRVGGAVAWLKHDGLLVPSARDSKGKNLVIFTANQPPEAEIKIIASQAI